VLALGIAQRNVTRHMCLALRGTNATSYNGLGEAQPWSQRDHQRRHHNSCLWLGDVNPGRLGGPCWPVRSMGPKMARRARTLRPEGRKFKSCDLSVMYLLILFLPLLSFLVAASFGGHIGRAASAAITTSCIFITAVLSTIAFYEVALAEAACYVQAAI
jgi:hypothetical protein